MKDFLTEFANYATALGLSLGQPALAPFPAGHEAQITGRGANQVELGDNARRPMSYSESVRRVSGGNSRPLTFGRDFMWGVAVAGTQVEGWDNNSSWAAWERLGKTQDPKGVAVAAWERYEDDVDLAARTGANSFRMSIEWSRVEPRPGVFDQAALSRYVRVIDKARSLGLEPVVTLYHFAYPQWLDHEPLPDQEGPLSYLAVGPMAEWQGAVRPAGWERKAAPVAYAQYVSHVARAMRGKVRYWITINEPNIEPGLGYLMGVFPPGRLSPLAFARATENILKAHVAAYDILHRVDPSNQVSTNVFRMVRRQGHETVNWIPAMEPGETMLDRLAAWRDRPGAASRSTLDYVAFDYYYAFTLPEFFQLADYSRWPVHPAGIYDAAVYYHKRYGLPVLVAENGMAERKREPRPDGWTREAFLVNHVAELQRAAADGVPVLGYFYWSLMDNYEWGTYAPTFGLYEIDRSDPALVRKTTPAADVFRRLSRSNGVPADLGDRYLNRRS